MIKRLLLLFLIFFSLELYGLSYYSDKYYFSIDLPDSWELVDDSKLYNAFFRNDKKDSFAEVTAYELDSASNNDEMLNSFVKRYKMTGTRKNVTFCKYKGLSGDYTLNVKGIDLTMNIVVFKDDYFYYIVMGYSKSDIYENKKNEIYKIMQSVKIHYDDKVVYGNVEDSKPSNSLKETTPKNNKIITKEKNDKTYIFPVKWDKYDKEYNLSEDDYNNSSLELQKITSTGIWAYYNIDTNSDPDYNFTFWKKFYQDIYNKNYYRVSNIVNWFKDEAKLKKWSSYELATNVMKFIQVVPYQRPYEIIKDKSKAENILDFLTPNEVGKFKKGDCDTKSLFMVEILRQLGFDAILFYSYSYSHAMVGLNISSGGSYKTLNNKKYYFIEATYTGWKIGDLPPEMKDTNKWKVVPIQ